MNPDPEHQRRLKKAAEMLVENQVNMIKQIMIKSAMGVIEGGMEAVQEAKKREWVGLNHFDRTLLRTTYAPLKPIYHDEDNSVRAEVVSDWDAFFDTIEAKLREKNA